MSSRRPQGEGSVCRLPDGRWRGVVDLGWHDGKRRRKYITRGSQAEVVRELRRLTAAAEAGRLPIARAPTLGQWLERYLDEVAAPSVRPSSLRRYRQELRLYIAPALGKVPLDKLRPSQVSDFYRSQLLHLSPGSVRRLHALLRRSLGVAVRWQLIPWNPVTAVDPPSLTSVEVHPFDANEARLFMAAASCDRFHARWLIAVLLGLRQGEVLGLTWRDVDHDQRVLAVRQTLQYHPGEGFHLVPPKTARSRRIVPLPNAVIDALKVGMSSRRPTGSQRALSSGRTGVWSLRPASARPCPRAMTIGNSDGWSPPPACAVFGCMTCGTPLLRSCWPRA
jgi:integrase